MRIFPRFDQWRSGMLAALARFPWNLICGLAGAAAMITSLHASNDSKLIGQCLRLAMTAVVGMPLFFSLRMLREHFDRLRHWPIELLGLPLLAAWFFAQPARPTDAPAIVLIRWLLLLAALHFFAAVSAYVRGAEKLGFWQFNRKLFLRFCLAVLYTGVLTLGFELALLSADKLFDLNIRKTYGDLFFVMAGIFHPAFFLAGIPSDFRALDSDNEYPRGLKAFTQFALAPLVAVYTAILCAYTAKILITRTWPHGWVAFPVLLLSGIGILAFLFLSPLRWRADERWAIWFTRNFPRALAPLSILLLLSLRVRISEYGVTEERYLGVVAGFWILAWAIVFILRKNAGIRWIPYSLAAICLLAAFGPWSAGAVSKTSQVRRITHLLQARGLWKDDHAAPASGTINLTKEDSTDLRSTLTYLIHTHGGTAIQKIFEPLARQLDWKNLNSWGGTHDLMMALNISNCDLTGPDTAPPMMVSRIESDYLDVNGFRRVWRLRAYNLTSHQESDVRILLQDGVLKVTTDQEYAPHAIPIDALLIKLDSNPSAQLPGQNLTVDFMHGARSFRIVFDSLGWYRAPEGLRVRMCELYLLEK